MKIKSRTLAAAIFSLVVLSGCSTVETRPTYGGTQSYNQHQIGSHQVQFGYIDSIRPVIVQREGGIGSGAVLGGIVGGLIGSQIGGGSGRDIATVGGVIAGGVVGNQVQQNRSVVHSVEVTIRLDSGHYIVVVQANDTLLNPGNIVRVVGSGSSARVTAL